MFCRWSPRPPGGRGKAPTRASAESSSADSTFTSRPGRDIDERSDGSWILKGRDGNDVARMPKDGYYFDFLVTTMAGKQIDPDAFQPCDTVTDEELDEIAEHSRFFYENTDKALLGWGASISLMGLSALLSDNITQGSLDEWLCMLMTEQEVAHEMMGRCVDAAIERIELYHQAIGDRCFAWGVASDDAGTQRGELASAGPVPGDDQAALPEAVRLGPHATRTGRPISTPAAPSTAISPTGSTPASIS